MSDIEQLVSQATAEFAGIGDAAALEQAKARTMLGAGSRFLQGAAVTLAFQNVALWSDYSGPDPEVNAQTGAFSRQGGSELLALQFNQSVRSGTPLAVAFIDLDEFKRINDEHGHEAGDRALAEAVQQMTRQLRTGDILARWGGEEFVIIMPNTAAAKAAVGLERTRAAGFGQRPEGGPLTACIGIAERSADQVDDWSMLVDLADARMYEAKQSGRNRIVTRPAA